MTHLGRFFLNLNFKDFSRLLIIFTLFFQMAHMTSHPDIMYFFNDPHICIRHVVQTHVYPPYPPWRPSTPSLFLPTMSPAWITQLLLHGYRHGTRVAEEFPGHIRTIIIRYTDPQCIGWRQNNTPTRTVEIHYQPRFNRITTGYPV